mgnify:CR=1 FL=1
MGKIGGFWIGFLFGIFKGLSMLNLIVSAILNYYVIGYHFLGKVEDIHDK